MSYDRARHAMCGIVFFLFCLSGCSYGPVIGLVDGTVTLNGQPLAEGCLVNFVPQSSGADYGGGLTDEAGHFVVVRGEHPGLPVGEYAVVILPPPQDVEESAATARKNMSAILGALESHDKSQLEALEFPQSAVVPRKYWTDSTSGLRVTVARGKNAANFELTTAE